MRTNSQSATVKHWLPPPPDERFTTHDLALLELAEPAPAVATVASPVSSPPDSTHDLTLYGYPSEQSGLWVDCRVKDDPLDTGLLQLRSKRGETRIRPGYSGGGVWLKGQQPRPRLVGILTAASTSDPTTMAIPATAIPNSWIGELWPALTSWIVFGAGRLGRGFLNLVADEADAKTLLIVAGRQTNRDMIQQYNENKYSVRRCGFLEVSLSNYHFLTYDNLSAISEVVSQPLTQVLSTSVGIENLGAVALAIAQGLNDRPHSKLQIIACENGLAPNAPKHSPSEVLREHLTNLIGPDALERSTEFPEAVADVIVPDAGSLHDPIVVSSGYLFLESTEATRRLFEGSQIVRLLKREDIAILRQRKLYCLNSLHSFLAVMGDLLGIATIEEVLGCPELIPTIRRLSSQLASATSEDPKYEIDGSDAYAYAEEVRRRMAEVSDPTDRVLLRAARGDYILDGRILGPIKDAGILKQPARASEFIACGGHVPLLVHECSRCATGSSTLASSSSADCDQSTGRAGATASELTLCALTNHDGTGFRRAGCWWFSPKPCAHDLCGRATIGRSVPNGWHHSDFTWILFQTKDHNRGVPPATPPQRV